MIVRDALRCGTCGAFHVVRIGMGQEEKQSHRFPCRSCREEIGVALIVDYDNVGAWVELAQDPAVLTSSNSTILGAAAGRTSR